MPGRKPLYQSEAERPVSLCVRVPRELYEQVQRQMDLRRISLTEAALDALRLWVETPADPRDSGASPSGNTIVLQQFEERVDARLEALEAALATLRVEAAVSTHTIQYDNSITDVIQKSDAAMPADGTPPTGRGQRKLTPRQQRALRDKYQRGVSVPALMDEYGIGRATVFRYLQSEKR